MVTSFFFFYGNLSYTPPCTADQGAVELGHTVVLLSVSQVAVAQISTEVRLVDHASNRGLLQCLYPSLKPPKFIFTPPAVLLTAVQPSACTAY